MENISEHAGISVTFSGVIASRYIVGEKQECGQVGFGGSHKKKVCT